MPANVSATGATAFRALAGTAAGFVIEAPVGARVRAGEPLVTVHARTQELVDRVAGRVLDAWRIVDHEVRRPPHVLARVDTNGVTRAD